MSVVIELPSVCVVQRRKEKVIRSFSLTLKGVTVEVSAIGAGITRFLVPSDSGTLDDIVLGYKSVKEMFESGNPVYFGVVVGRIANRIREGRLQLHKTGEIHQLEINNPPNHLHGGSEGFGRKIWDAAIVRNDSSDCVRFTLRSEAGDQNYPGSVDVSVTYSLIDSEQGGGVRLVTWLHGDIVGDVATPLNLAQHSYFNLSRHDDPNGVLDHVLTLHCDAYTPVDASSIPTRNVCHVSDDPVMDWRNSRTIRRALIEYGVAKANLGVQQAFSAVSRSSEHANISGLSSKNDLPTAPFGFDHNYVARPKCNQSGLQVVAVFEHRPTHRILTIRTDTPGIQLYTSNYLDGSQPNSDICKNNATYGRWQAVCLETQHFPDSILVDSELHPEFAQGRCIVLTPENPSYDHHVEYEFVTSRNMNGITPELLVDSLVGFHGTDTNDNEYDSVEEMWRAQGVYASAKSSWYERTAEFYEDNCDTTIDGVLGGFPEISDIDLEGSRAFCEEVVRIHPTTDWSVGAACECGAGIGRVTKGLLLSLGVVRCDLVESSSRLLSAAPEYIGSASSQCRFFCQGLQNWQPAPNTYSIIWVQWVLIYLTDDDIVTFLRRCGSALVEGGVIILKENTCEDSDFCLDVDDASVARSLRYWLYLCRTAGLRVVLRRRQDNFPGDLFPVDQIALEVDDN